MLRVKVLGKVISMISLTPRTTKPAIFLLLILVVDNTVESSGSTSGPLTPSLSSVSSDTPHYRVQRMPTSDVTMGARGAQGSGREHGVNMG